MKRKYSFLMQRISLCPKAWDSVTIFLIAQFEGEIQKTGNGVEETWLQRILLRTGCFIAFSDWRNIFGQIQE